MYLWSASEVVRGRERWRGREGGGRWGMGRGGHCMLGCGLRHTERERDRRRRREGTI